MRIGAAYLAAFGVFLAFFLSACNSGDGNTEARTSAAKPAASEPAQTEANDAAAGTTAGAEEPAVPAAPATLPPPLPLLRGVKPASPPATVAELRYLGHANAWWLGVASDIRLVLLESHAIVNDEHMDEPDDSPLKAAIARLRDCENRMYRTLARKTSERLQRLYALMTDTCFVYQDVAATAAQIMVNGTSATLRESWAAVLDDAGRHFARVMRATAAYEPSLSVDLPTIDGVTQESRSEPLFARAARKAAGKDVVVQCWSRGDWPEMRDRFGVFGGQKIGPRHLGITLLFGERLNLAPFVCEGLVVLVYLGKRPQHGIRVVGLGASVATLAHEAMHSRGVADEATAECFAVQSVEETARRLGVEPAYAHKLAVTYWKRGYPSQDREYRSDDCRPGGALDLRPDQTAWPS